MASREHRNFASLFSFSALAISPSPARVPRILLSVTVSNFDILSFS